MPITPCTVYSQLVDLAGRPQVGVSLQITPRVSPGVAVLTTDGQELDPRGVTVTTAADGSFSTALTPSASTLPAGVQYQLSGPAGIGLSFAVPTQANYNPVNGASAAKPATFGVPAICLVSGALVDLAGTPRVGVTLTAGLVGWDKGLVATSSGGIVLPKPVSATTITDGSFVLPVLRAVSLVPSGVVFTYIASGAALYGRFIVPDAAGALWASLV